MNQHTDPSNPRTELIRSVADLQEDESLALVCARLENNDDPLQIVEDCQEGLRQVGERYERREYYLSGLIMAGEIFRQVMELLAPLIQVRFTGHESVSYTHLTLPTRDLV